MVYRIHKCFSAYEIQRCSAVILDGSADVDWHTVTTCWDEAEAQRILKSLTEG